MTKTIVAKAAGIATRKYQCSCHQETGMVGLLEYDITRPQCEGKQLQRSLSNSFEIETFAQEISQTLIENTKPHIASLKKMFKELKMQNDKEVKAKLLPLLQKYISNPI